MAGLYLPSSVAQRISDCGIKVVRWSGCDSRSASQGGFVSYEGVIMHHTADAQPHDSHGNWNYTITNSDNSPEYNFGIDQDGTVNYLAAGGVNSSGKGGPLTLQTGSVPTNGANYRLVAISLDIDGTGEVCSVPMIVSSVVTAVCVLQFIGRQTGDCTAHKEYCGPGTTTPGRKIDPYGNWAPAAYGASLSWGAQQGRIDDFRGQLWWAWSDPAAWAAQQLGTAPPTPTPPDPTPPTPPPDTNWPASLTSTLPTIQKGSQGIQVKKMQHLLAGRGYMNEANTSNYDGVWGNGTDSAKARFDADNGLGSGDTSCGPKSWAALCGPMPNLKKGDSGLNVKLMQHLLAACGFMNEANTANYDGQWGNGTDSAKVNFDNASGLTPSPPTDCGNKSWTALLT